MFTGYLVQILKRIFNYRYVILFISFLVSLFLGYLNYMLLISYFMNRSLDLNIISIHMFLLNGLSIMVLILAEDYRRSLEFSSIIDLFSLFVLIVLGLSLFVIVLCHINFYYILSLSLFMIICISAINKSNKYFKPLFNLFMSLSFRLEYIELMLFVVMFALSASIVTLTAYTSEETGSIDINPYFALMYFILSSVFVPQLISYIDYFMMKKHVIRLKKLIRKRFPKNYDSILGCLNRYIHHVYRLEPSELVLYYHFLLSAIEVNGISLWNYIKNYKNESIRKTLNVFACKSLNEMFGTLTLSGLRASFVHWKIKEMELGYFERVKYFFEAIAKCDLRNEIIVPSLTYVEQLIEQIIQDNAK